MKKIKLFEDFNNDLNESKKTKKTSKNWLSSHMKSIQKKLKCNDFNIVDSGAKKYVDFDDKLRLLIRYSKVIGYNIDMSENFFELPSSIKTFKDIEKNIKLLSVEGSKPVSVFSNSVRPIHIVDLSKYGIKELKFVDFETLLKDFPWILDAKIKDAVITTTRSALNKEIIVWKSGEWLDGDWKGSVWESGTWHNGTWHQGIWKDGVWKDGVWKGHSWEDGTWHGGTWETGEWDFGTWHDGTWEKGIWRNGEWKDGTWKNGSWRDGVWRDGTWEHGRWIHGIFKGGAFKGGTFASGYWKGGTWENGTWDKSNLRIVGEPDNI